jgi:hypothetical protein
MTLSEEEKNKIVRERVFSGVATAFVVVMLLLLVVHSFR